MPENTDFAERIARINARNGGAPRAPIYVPPPPGGGAGGAASKPLAPGQGGILLLAGGTLVGLALIAAATAAMMHQMLGEGWMTKLAAGNDSGWRAVDTVIMGDN